MIFGEETRNGPLGAHEDDLERSDLPRHFAGLLDPDGIHAGLPCAGYSRVVRS
jgi:hypothetical protein